MKNKIDQANQEAYHRIDSAQVHLVDIKYAGEVLPGFSDHVIGHAGPPVAWAEMCGPMRGAVIGAIKYEGWAESDEEAEALVEAGRIKFVSNHSVGAVGPMTGIITRSMPLFEVFNETYGNYAYCTFNEGLGRSNAVRGQRPGCHRPLKMDGNLPGTSPETGPPALGTH